MLLFAAVLVIYIILGILYESFIHPLTILSGLPSAGIGALAILMLFNMDLSVIAMIGVVMLIGIVKKNAIMMVDFAIERRVAGRVGRAGDRRGGAAALPADHDDHDLRAARRAADRAGAGAGAELRQPLGITVVGGLMVSQLLDAVHHAGGLHLVRQADRHALQPGLGQALARSAAGRRRRPNSLLNQGR